MGGLGLGALAVDFERKCEDAEGNLTVLEALGADLYYVQQLHERVEQVLLSIHDKYPFKWPLVSKTYSNIARVNALQGGLESKTITDYGGESSTSTSTNPGCI